MKILVYILLTLLISGQAIQIMFLHMALYWTPSLQYASNLTTCLAIVIIACFLAMYTMVAFMKHHNWFRVCASISLV
uniref:Uncharacterized protein n=1 Tax=Caenorhabditis japonica TaxID=281687 RepID=A0A8R1EQJ9_CAEJA